MKSLCQALEERGPAISVRVTAEMYDHPFWPDRFGERGRIHADKDANYHIAYLVEALTANDPGVFVRYSRWLQTLLTNRGMCTRHIDDKFARLERAFVDEIPGAEPAAAILREGRRALAYEVDAAQELTAGTGPHRFDLCDLASAALQEELGFGWHVFDEELGLWLEDIVLDGISYVADFVAYGRANVLLSYPIWLSGYMWRKRRLPQTGRHLLASLRIAIARSSDIGPKAKVAASRVLLSAISQLDDEPGGCLERDSAGGVHNGGTSETREIMARG